jgi:hypothetical protein
MLHPDCWQLVCLSTGLGTTIDRWRLTYFYWAGLRLIIYFSSGHVLITLIACML